MGLFSFGSKDDVPRRRGANAKSARVERRSRRTERAGDADAMLLDPTLPEKQRARRRLVGAIALVIAAVVVLPMVLDSHPKPLTDNIAIDIPNRPASVPSRVSDDAADPDEGAAMGVAPPRSATDDEARADISTKFDQTASALPPAKTRQSAAAGSRASSSTQDARGSAAKPQAQARSEPAKPAPAPSAPSAAQSDTGAPPAPPGARFAVQLGVFADDASARQWESKLKAAGVPAYLERRKQADGSTRALLRAGPFADRAAASAAIAKVREAGLTANAAQ